MYQFTTRDKFREICLNRDKNKCVFCDTTENLSVHHILERRLFTEPNEMGGYHPFNGATVCEYHHIECEATNISVEEVREACGITKKVIPSHLYDDHIYDKWGNIILANGQRMIGELFFDESVQKILKQHNKLHLFTEYVKYPRTYHVNWSEGMHDDDRMHKDMSHFIGKEVVVTTKLDGECFPAFTPILMADKTIKNISNIKVGDIVFGVDLNNNLVKSTVLNIFNNGKTDKWLKIYFQNPFTDSKKYIVCTENHKLFVDNIYLEAKDVVIGSNFLHYVKYCEPSQIQKEILIGKLLGDGSFSSNKRHIQYTHKLDHKEYSDFINLSLTDAYSNSLLDKNLNSFSKKTKYKSWTKSFQWIKNLSKEMLVNNIKIIPKSLIDKITPLSLAILYMDDGNLTENDKQNPRMHFSICNYDKESCLNLQSVFTNLNIKTTITNSDGYNYLHISASSVDNFCELIKNYIPKVMQYKLPKKHRNFEVQPILGHSLTLAEELIDVEILSINILTDLRYTNKYDIETETHNYFANGVLVHNCTSMYNNYIHARSIDSPSNFTRNWVKGFHAHISSEIPKGWRICGENMYAEHSISYKDLDTYFYGFSIWNDKNVCLSWDETLEWFELLGIMPVPLLYRGVYDEEAIKKLWSQDKWATMEGYVIRLADEIPYGAFKRSVGKFVRKGHVNTVRHWLYGSRIVKNELKSF